MHYNICIKHFYVGGAFGLISSGKKFYLILLWKVYMVKRGGGAETEREGKGAEETYFLWFRQVMKAVSSLKFDALS